MTCAEARGKLHHYLDNELQPAESMLLEAHLVECAGCRREYDSLVSVVETVRAAQPLYKPPEESFRNAKRLIEARQRKAAWFRGAIAASVLIAALAGFTALRRQAAPDRFAGFAADSHLRYTRGAMPLDIREAEPRAMTRWLSERLRFHLTLPDYQPGQTKRYSLVGARLLQYVEDDVAYLAYRMNDRSISLLIASADRIAPGGGEIYRSGGLEFHTTSRDGLRIITWRDKGLSYALVSDLKEVGAESCAICHGSEADQRKLAPLRPRV